MARAIKVEYTHSFREQLYTRFDYLSRHIGGQAAQDLLIGFLNSFESRINHHPKSSPLCAEAADLGLKAYHDYVDIELQLRVIYRFSDTEKAAYGLLFLNTRQSIRQALIQYCLQKE